MAFNDIDFNLNCWYSGHCPVEDSGQCDKRICHRFLEMSFLISNCGMRCADKYMKSIEPQTGDLPVFYALNEIKNNVVDFVTSGKSITIKSTFSLTGKTTWALKILYRFFHEVWNGNGFKVRGYFIYVPEFLAMLKTPGYKDSQEYKELHKILNSTDLVIWDSLLDTQLPSWDQTTIDMYLNKRQLNELSNIYTGLWVDEKTLLNNVGMKIGSRILACENYHIQGTACKVAADNSVQSLSKFEELVNGTSNSVDGTRTDSNM